MMQGNDSFRLIVRRGPQPNQIYDLNKDIVTLGRDITNDITINDPEVSRHHMRLTRGAGGFTVEDLGSTNGTFVNGQRLTGARPLRNGDMIGLGETVTLAYEAGAGAGAAPSGEGVGGTVASAPQAPGFGPPQQGQGQQYGGSGFNIPDFSQGIPDYEFGQQQGQQQPPPPGAPAPSGDFGGAPYGVAPAPPQAPPGAGYEYDPYDMREEEPRNTARWVLIGCVGLSFFCCCSTTIFFVVVDQFCLWDQLPVIYNIIEATGRTQVCP